MTTIRVRAAWLVQAWLIASIAAGTTPASAQAAACSPEVGALASVEGEVFYSRAGTFDWQPAALGQSLCRADSVRVGPRSRAALRLINDAILRLDQNTTLQLSDVQAEPERRSFLQLIAGVMQSFVRHPRLLAINTPYLNAAIEGTEFLVAAAERQSSVTVLEGVVRATNDQGEVVLAGGEEAVAEPGRAPVKQIVVRPRDSVQWAIYYPPVLSAGPLPADLRPGLRTALERYAAGDTAAAFRALEQVPAAARDPRYHLYEAELLLSVGRVGEAEAALGQGAPESAAALALRSVIKVAQDDRAAALALAQRAVELAPEQAAPWIALSYAQQARFDLQAARTSLERAVMAQPEDALAWARLAELRQALGQRAAARTAAERAATLAPRLGRTQTVLGFARLVQFDTAGASEAFARAIELGSADPLPHLGLGLARIRDGEVAAGRGDLEVAAGLDPNNALIRSYLGKAYFEEKRAPLDAQQLAIAKELDPLDPTPYLYDAIRKQTENQPGAALDDLETSIRLNDNRAVYRSRLQLDQDRAARGTSLARVYDDLGFYDVAVQKAAGSVALDPAQAAAHRFLSDALIGVRRTEVARVSELLQAQMLQDVNINPVQPSLSEVNLNIVTSGGPAEAGFNEFTPLFERDQVQVNGSGFAGNNDTYGGEGVVSALHGPYSASAGVFHYRTNGWRDNNGVDHDLGDVFLQAAVTPELNAQVEMRARKTDTGDLAFNFDPDDFSPNERHSLDQKSVRLGLRYSPTESSDALLSFTYSDSEETGTDRFVDPDFGPTTSDADVDEHGYRVEGQYIYRRETFNVLAGMAYAEADAQFDAALIGGGIPLIDLHEPQNTNHVHPYVYGNLNLPSAVTWTLGLSYDDFEQADLEVKQVNPKFGVEWRLGDRLRLRGAVTQIVKPPLATNQTLEPTRVAGFNQLFDDANGDQSLRYGVGVDWQPADHLFAGAEATWRDVKTSFFDDIEEKTRFDDWYEQTHRGYLYWVPLPEWAFTLELVYDRFKAERSIVTLDDTPEQVETWSVPLSVHYFHPSGVFAGLRGTFVDQQVARTPGNFFGLAEGSDDFFVVDASAGYRFPNRHGVASVEINNLFDSGFHYQDDSYREFSDAPSIGPYIPDLQIVGRITLNW